MKLYQVVLTMRTAANVPVGGNSWLVVACFLSLDTNWYIYYGANICGSLVKNKSFFVSLDQGCGILFM